MPLTDKQIKAILPEDKPKKYFDGNGLYLEVAVSGGKWWRLKYRFQGQQREQGSSDDTGEPCGKLHVVAGTVQGLPAQEVSERLGNHFIWPFR